MYESYYGFTEKPFNITPDPKYLFLSAKHQEAISHLTYGIQERGGFVAITGEIGTGKTILCRHLLNGLDERTQGAVILNPNLSELELLKAINEDFGIHSTANTKKGLIDELNQFLLEHRLAGHNMVLVIDEAQNLAPPVLEQIRLLSNLETEKEKLIQIILLGQPELRELLERPDLAQLSQRITARYHLRPLDAKEATAYIAHRMGIAGNATAAKFPARTLRKIYAFSGGTPRLINILCDRLLLAGFAANTADITPAMVRQAAREISGEPLRAPLLATPGAQIAAYAATALVCLGIGWGASGAWTNTPAALDFRAASVGAASLAIPQRPAPAPTLTPAPTPASPSPKPAALVESAPAPAAALEPAAPRPAPVPVTEPPAPATPAAPRKVAIAAAPVTPEAPPAAKPIGSISYRRTARAPMAVARAEPADAGVREQRLISSLFNSTENRVVNRTPGILEEALPPEPATRVASAPPPAVPPGLPAAPREELRLSTAAQVGALVADLQPIPSRLTAAQALFSLWGRDFQVPKEANDPNFHDFYKLAMNQGMRCSEVWANMDTLQRINLPGILEVFSPDAPTSRYVVLSAVHADGTGTVLWGHRASARVNLNVLDEFWRRRVFIFWQDVEPVGEVMREGDRGNRVQWLQDRLHTLGHFPEASTGTYGPSTRRAVSQFQEAYRLVADGIVGPRTRMVLYSSLDAYATPNLIPRGGGAS